jgi:hypothetical protein
LIEKFRLNLLPVALLLSAACAAGSRPSAGADTPASVVFVEVENDVVPRTSVTVRIVSATGQKVLGTIGPGRTATLRFEEAYIEAAYRLIARQDDGTEETSRQFQAFEGALIRWRLSNNRISIGSR